MAKEKICKSSTTPKAFCRKRWAMTDAMWKSMIAKESIYIRSSSCMSRHEKLAPRYRSTLLAWTMVICKVRRISRETFHLSVEYLDRYLPKTEKIISDWSRLKLVAITALFVAMKYEEIEHPYLPTFTAEISHSLTSDGIKSQEKDLLRTLEWRLSPVTPISWLNLYLVTKRAKRIQSVECAEFSLAVREQQIFVHATQLLDLCTMDLGSLKYSTAILAAAALYYFTSIKVVTEASGFELEEIVECINWMNPFYFTVRYAGLQPLQNFDPVPQKHWHQYQTSPNTVDTWDEAIRHRRERVRNTANYHRG